VCVVAVYYGILTIWFWNMIPTVSHQGLRGNKLANPN